MNKLDEVEDEAQVMEVHVINRNDFTIQDRFDGTEFKFPQDKAVSVPPDATLVAPTLPVPVNVAPLATLTLELAIEPVTLSVPALTVVTPV